MSNNYYFDSNNSSVGDGTINNPWRQLDKLLALVPPYSAQLKKGSVFVGNWKIAHALFLNQAEVSYITAYGDSGPRPILKMLDASEPVIEIVNAQNIYITDIDIIIDNPFCDADPVLLLHPIGNNEHVANVYVKHMTFTYSPVCKIKSRTRAIQLNSNSGTEVYPTPRRASFIGIEKVTVYNGDVGANVKGVAPPEMIAGNSNASDATFRPYNATATDCAFINMRGDGCIMFGVEGESSGMHRCIYTGYRYDSEYIDASGDAVTPYQAAFWYYNCYGCVSTYLEAYGCQPIRSDRMAFDFDQLTSNCVFRYCISKDNGGGALLAIMLDKPEGVMAGEDWFVNKNWGNNNNLMEYCVSYNDGWSTVKNGWNGWYHKTMFFAYVNRLTVRNCLFIDTMTRGKDYQASLMHGYFEKDVFDNQVTFENNIFYLKNGASFQTSADETTPLPGVVFNKNIMYSGDLGETGSQLQFTGKHKATMIGNIFKDPKLLNVCTNGPHGVLASLLVKLANDSPAINAGYANATPDINGVIGNNIGWQQ